MGKNELRDLLIEAKELVKKLNKVYLNFTDEEIREATEIRAIPCDACRMDDPWP